MEHLAYRMGVRKACPAGLGKLRVSGKIGDLTTSGKNPMDQHPHNREYSVILASLALPFSWTDYLKTYRAYKLTAYKSFQDPKKSGNSQWVKSVGDDTITVESWCKSLQQTHSSQSLPFQRFSSSYQSGSSRIFHYVRIQRQELRLLLPNQKNGTAGSNIIASVQINSKVLPPNLVEIFQ